MLELGRKMLSMSLQWAEKERSLSSLEVEALQGLVSTILAKVKVGDTRLNWKSCSYVAGQEEGGNFREDATTFIK